MNDLSLFNLGFRCESISENLQNYNSTGKVNKRIIIDALKILKDGFNFREEISSHLYSKRTNYFELEPIILQIFIDKNPEEIYSELSEIFKILDKIYKLEPSVRIEKAVSFFDKISATCLHRSKQLQYNENESHIPYYELVST